MRSRSRSRQSRFRSGDRGPRKARKVPPKAKPPGRQPAQPDKEWVQQVETRLRENAPQFMLNMQRAAKQSTENHHREWYEQLKKEAKVRTANARKKLAAFEEEAAARAEAAAAAAEAASSSSSAPCPRPRPLQSASSESSVAAAAPQPEPSAHSNKARVVPPRQDPVRPRVVPPPRVDRHRPTSVLWTVD